jgi:hypothetical protein
MSFPIREVVGAGVTLIVGVLAYRQTRRTRRSGQYITDRQVAYKEIWKALEETNLFVRKGRFTQQEFDSRMQSANALVMQHGLFVDEYDQELVTRYLAAMREVGRVLRTKRADKGFDELRTAMATTGAFPSLEDLVPEFKEAIREVDESRRAVVRRFREQMGAGFA